jgi:hypothetical protein
MHILDYLKKLPETPQSELMKYLHGFISSYPNIQSKVMFTTPFYTRHRWMIYLSKQKDRSIEVCFVNARWFAKHLEWLDFKKRKQVAGITYHQVGDVDEEILDMLIQEALSTDDRHKPKSKKEVNFTSK